MFSCLALNVKLISDTLYSISCCLEVSWFWVFCRILSVNQKNCPISQLLSLPHIVELMFKWSAFLFISSCLQPVPFLMSKKSITKNVSNQFGGVILVYDYNISIQCTFHVTVSCDFFIILVQYKVYPRDCYITLNDILLIFCPSFKVVSRKTIISPWTK